MHFYAELMKRCHNTWWIWFLACRLFMSRFHRCWMVTNDYNRLWNRNQFRVSRETCNCDTWLFNWIFGEFCTIMEGSSRFWMNYIPRYQALLLLNLRFCPWLLAEGALWFWGIRVTIGILSSESDAHRSSKTRSASEKTIVRWAVFPPPNKAATSSAVGLPPYSNEAGSITGRLRQPRMHKSWRVTHFGPF